MALPKCEYSAGSQALQAPQSALNTESEVGLLLGNVTVPGSDPQSYLLIQRCLPPGLLM